MIVLWFFHAALTHTSYLSFFYTVKIFGEQNLHRNLHSKLPIFRVKSVKTIYTDMSVATATNIRYVYNFSYIIMFSGMAECAEF